MQDSKRKTNSRSHRINPLKALSIGLVALLSQACQTAGPLNPDQWNARTNAVNAFTQAVQAHNQGQRATWGPATPYRAPTQSNPFAPRPVIIQQVQPNIFQEPAGGW